MLSEKFLSDLQKSHRESAEISAALKKVEGMSRSQLEELKTSGTKIEKNYAALKLMTIESHDYLNLVLKNTANAVFEKAFNDGFKKALKEAGYELVGYVQKIK